LIAKTKELTTAYEGFVHAILVAQLGSFTLVQLELYSNLLMVEQIDPFENNAKGTLSNLLADTVMFADDISVGTRVHHRD
jgi:hypothetical protein